MRRGRGPAPRRRPPGARPRRPHYRYLPRSPSTRIRFCRRICRMSRVWSGLSGGTRRPPVTMNLRSGGGLSVRTAGVSVNALLRAPGPSMLAAPIIPGMLTPACRHAAGALTDRGPYDAPPATSSGSLIFGEAVLPPHATSLLVRVPVRTTAWAVRRMPVLFRGRATRHVFATADCALFLARGMLHAPGWACSWDCRFPRPGALCPEDGAGRVAPRRGGHEVLRRRPAVAAHPRNRRPDPLTLRREFRFHCGLSFNREILLRVPYYLPRKLAAK